MKLAVRIEKWGRNFAAFGVVATLLFVFAASGDAKTWTVTTTADSATNTGSIRYIVLKADDGDTIKFTSGGATLTDYLKLDKKLTIEGPATITQTGGNRIFHISAGVSVTLKKLKLTGGGRNMMEGGAIYNYGSLKMEDCTVSGNSCIYEGGGIFSSGSLKMKNCVIENNTSQNRCGGVVNKGELEIDGGRIRNNSCGSGGSSALFNAGGASAEIEDCEIASNTGSGGPGGIKNEGTLKMTGCTIASHSGATSGGIENTGSLELKRCSITGNTSGCNGGGIYNHSGVLTAETCLITGNSARYEGGGICHHHALHEPNAAEKCRLKNITYVINNTPDQIAGPYKADDNCTIGSAPNSSATAFSGYSGETAPEPRSITGDADVAEVKNALADPASDLFAAVKTALSNDLGGISGDVSASLAGMTASLYYANTFENVAIESRDLVVEYTASYPERARYYALFARSDDSGYELPTRGVQFELQAGQPLPDDMTTPDFYEEGEGLMTWRNVVTDNGSFDLEPAVGVVTFRVCSVRAEAQAVAAASGASGCSAVGASPFALLLGVPPLLLSRKRRS